MNKIILGFFIIFSFFSFSLGVVETAQAANYLCECLDGNQASVLNCDQCPKACLPSKQLDCRIIAGTSIDTSNTNTNTPITAISLDNPLDPIKTPQELLGQILNGMFGIIGSLALVMFIFGGLVWMTSAGNPEKVKKGRDILVWSAIGLFVIFSSYALVRFVLSSIAG